MIDRTRFVIAIAAAGALIWLYAVILHQGAEGVRISIERQNNDARNAADDARSAYDSCRDDGRVWDFGAGRCGGPAADRRR